MDLGRHSQKACCTTIPQLQKLFSPGLAMLEKRRPVFISPEFKQKLLFILHPDNRNADHRLDARQARIVQP